MNKLSNFFIFCVLLISILLYIIFNYIIKTTFEINFELKKFDELNQNYNEETNKLINELSLVAEPLKFNLANILTMQNQSNYKVNKTYNQFIKNMNDIDLDNIRSTNIKLSKKYIEQIMNNHFIDNIGSKVSELKVSNNSDILKINKIYSALNEINIEDSLNLKIIINDNHQLNITDINLLKNYLEALSVKNNLINSRILDYEKNISILLNNYFNKSENFIFKITKKSYGNINGAIFLLLINIFGLLSLYIFYKKALNGKK